jgi:hypothetical protein
MTILVCLMGVGCSRAGNHITCTLWSSYDRIWFSKPDKQEVLILTCTSSPLFSCYLFFFFWSPFSSCVISYHLQDLSFPCIIMLNSVNISLYSLNYFIIFYWKNNVVLPLTCLVISILFTYKYYHMFPSQFRMVTTNKRAFVERSFQYTCTSKAFNPTYL